ncbi:hypothetical protein CYMTET_51724 [Cymbomonas tetramitiformis]|uniref:Pentacotripeptide-repeat region of PRORP domain-containing protein n=1 Tax=Cymbomonas tetramitiformis TaxID=36881 RepID=A0AAE0BLX7_9CHLO|nr:hypothetical protein CYMTET_51724 [Cymbomonas tetramitiformis]
MHQEQTLSLRQLCHISFVRRSPASSASRISSHVQRAPYQIRTLHRRVKVLHVTSEQKFERRGASWGGQFGGLIRLLDQTSGEDISLHMPAELNISAPTLGSLLVGLVNLNNVERAWELLQWAQLVQPPLPLNSIHYTVLVTAFGRRKALDRVIEVLNDMNRWKVEADTQLLKSAVKSCMASRAWQEALDVFHSLATQPGLRGSASIYNDVLYAAFNLKLPSGHSFRLYRDIEAAGLEELDQFTFVELIKLLYKYRHWREVVLTFEAMRDLGYKANIVTWTTYLMCLNRTGEVQRSFEMFRQMQAEGVHADEKAYGVMINSCTSWKQASTIFEEMEAEGIQQSEVTYNTLLKIAGSTERAEAVLKLFEEMGSRGLQPDVVSYNTVLSALAEERMESEAEALLADMRADGVQPDRFTYTTLIAMCEEPGLADKARSCFADMEASGIEADSVAYNALVSSLLRGGRMLASFEVPAEMRANGVEPDQAMYEQLMKACEEAGDWERALLLFEELAASDLPAKYPSSANTYTSLIRVCQEAGKWETALQLLDRMKQAGGAPSAAIYNSTIAACAEGGQWRLALELLREMRRVEQEALWRLEGTLGADGPTSLVDQRTFVEVSRACSYAVKAEDTAAAVVARVEHTGIVMDEDVYTALIGAFTNLNQWQAGIQLLHQSQQLGLKVEEVAYRMLLRACSQAGHWKQVQQLLEEMRAAGMPLDLEAHCSLLRACQVAQAWPQGRAALRAIQAEGVVLDERPYNLLLATCMASPQPMQDAFALVVEMEAAGVEPTTSTYNSLIFICAAGKQWARALEVSPAVPETLRGQTLRASPRLRLHPSPRLRLHPSPRLRLHPSPRLRRHPSPRLRRHLP